MRSGSFAQTAGCSIEMVRWAPQRRRTTRSSSTYCQRALPRFGAQGESGSMMMGPSSLLPRFAVHVKPTASREEGFRSRRVAALVMIVDPVGPVRIDPALVQSMLGLTPAESKVAVLLAQGRTTRQIAATTGRGACAVRGIPPSVRRGSDAPAFAPR